MKRILSSISLVVLLASGPAYSAGGEDTPLMRAAQHYERARAMNDASAEQAMARYLALLDVQNLVQQLTGHLPAAVATESPFATLPADLNAAAERVARHCATSDPKTCLVTGALAALDGVTNLFDKTDALAATAAPLAAGGHFADIRSRALQIGDEGYRNMALTAMVRALARAGLTDQATQLLDDISNPVDKDDARNTLVLVFLESRDIPRAQALAQQITTPFPRAEAMGRVARALAADGQADQARAAFSESRRLLSGIADESERIIAMGRFAAALALAGQETAAERAFTEALDMARRADDIWVTAESLSQISRALSQAGQFDRARRVAAEMEMENIRAEAEQDIAIALAQAGQFDRARQIAGEIVDSRVQASAFSQIGAIMERAGLSQEAGDLYAQAEQIIARLQAPEDRIWPLFDLATALAERGDFSGALARARQIQDEGIRALALERVALKAAGAGALALAYDAARETSFPSSRSIILAAIARQL